MRQTGDPIEVLHVDDQPDFGALTVTYLERVNERLRVETVPSVEAGLDRLESSAVDCIVSDYEMPGQDGIDFLETVRADHPELPFILFTGKGGEEVASDAISAGVTEYLQKGPNSEQFTILANRIRNAVERARAQRDRRRHLQAIETAEEGISILTDDGHFAYVNEAYADIHGYDPEDIAGEHWELLFRDAEVRYIRETVLSRIDQTGHWYGEVTGLRADSTTFVGRHTIVRTERGERICTVQDVTEERERKRRFEAIFNNTYTYMGLLAPDGTVLEVNERTRSLGDLDREDVIGKPVWETEWFKHDDAARKTAKAAVDTASDGELYQGEIRLHGGDREAVIDFSVRPVTDENGDVTLLIPEGRDITERKRYTRRLETLIENLPGMVYRCRNERGWPMDDVRGDVASLTGYSADEIQIQTHRWGSDVVHPDDREAVWETVQESLDSGDGFEMTYRITTKGGEEKWVWERGQQTVAPTGTTPVLEGFITDISPRMHATERFREERAVLQQVLDALEGVVCVIGPDGDLRRWNRRLLAVTGYDEASVEEMAIEAFVPDGHQERLRETIDRVHEDGVQIIDIDLLTAEGGHQPVEFRMSRLTDADSNFLGVVGIGRERESRS